MNAKFKIAILIALTLLSIPLNFLIFFIIFYGSRILIVTSFFLILSIVLFFLRLPLFYSRLCIGFILEFAVNSTIMAVVESYYFEFLITLLVACAALVLVVSSLAQFLFGAKIFTRKIELVLNALAIMGFVLAVTVMVNLT